MSHIIEIGPDAFDNIQAERPATDQEIKKYYIYKNWLRLYAPGKAVDGDHETAWVEDKPDFGKGEILMIDIDFTKQVSIWAGFGRSERLFLKNNRPKDIRVYLIEVKSPVGDMFGGVHYMNFIIRNISTYRLADYNGYQVLDLPQISVEQHIAEAGTQFGIDGHNMLLAIEIISVYPGTDWNDTCITEIKN